MVQAKSQEQRRSHGGHFSWDLHQDTSGRVGADLKKKVRSMKISGFEERSPMDFQFKKTASVRNYMKPTRSSDARKAELQVTVTSPASTDKKKNLNTFMSSSSSSSLALKNLNRATCSSTLKDSKFPAAALVLNPEGNFKMRVCPYNYCSLNGHMHGFSPPPLPPLKCFVSERRRILKKQRSVGIETLFPVQTRGNEDDIIEISSDLFAEMPLKGIIGGKNCGDINIQEEKDEGTAWEDYEFEENGDDSEEEEMNSHVDFRDESQSIADNPPLEEFETEQSETRNLEAINGTTEALLNASDIDLEETDGFQSSKWNMGRKMRAEELGQAKEYNSKPPNLLPLGESETEHSEGVLDVNSLQPSEDESSNVEAIHETTEALLNASDIELKETDGIPGSKWNIRRKMRAEEELGQEKEFNPKPPTLLPLEPDPEAEKVDLRHQMMDGRRGAEEWMIDYALQHAVTRLGCSARKKKKVALLVEAFETVVPPHTCETPVSHGTSSSFTNLSFIQACS